MFLENDCETTRQAIDGVAPQTSNGASILGGTGRQRLCLSRAEKACAVRPRRSYPWLGPAMLVGQMAHSSPPSRLRRRAPRPREICRESERFKQPAAGFILEK